MPCVLFSFMSEQNSNINAHYDLVYHRLTFNDQKQQKIKQHFQSVFNSILKIKWLTQNIFAKNLFFTSYLKFLSK